MTGATLANSPLLYALIAIGLVAIVIFALYCYRKARAHCLELGLSAETINNVVKSSISFAIVPSIAIMVGLLTLSATLGVAWPWWRLSVIGSLSYELMASGYATAGMGVAASQVLNGDPSIFITVMFVMTIGVLAGPLMVAFVAKKYSTGIMKAKTANEWGTIMSGVFFLAMLSVYIPALLLNELPTALTLITGVVVMMFFGALTKKIPALGNFVMALTLIITLCLSVVWDRLFPV